MSEEYGSDFIVISDEEGNEYELEHLDTLEVDGALYMAFLPAESENDDGEDEMIIMRVIEENGEELFEAIDDDAELERIYEVFMNQLFGDGE